MRPITIIPAAEETKMRRPHLSFLFFFVFCFLGFVFSSGGNSTSTSWPSRIFESFSRFEPEGGRLTRLVRALSSSSLSGSGSPADSSFMESTAMCFLLRPKMLFFFPVPVQRSTSSGASLCVPGFTSFSIFSSLFSSIIKASRKVGVFLSGD